MTLKEEVYKHFGRCLNVDNGTISVSILLRRTPRIIAFGFSSGDNILYEQPADLSDNLYLDNIWSIVGGHRFWLAPESVEHCYIMEDDFLVETEQLAQSVIVRLESTIKNGALKKIMAVTIPEDGNVIQVAHSLKNVSKHDEVFSLWAITCLKSGGTFSIDNTKNENRFHPNRCFCFWPDSDPRDERIEYGSETLRISAKANHNKALKIGMPGAGRSLHYKTAEGIVFEKYVSHVSTNDTLFPDNGSAAEVYVCDHMIELETLSPLYTIAPSEEISHCEEWILTNS